MAILDRLTIASRGSRLALRQSEIVAEALTRAHPGLAVEVLTVTTKGDVDQRPFAEIGGKGLFTSEVERAVIEGRADVAVHSAKDLTAQLGPGCGIVCVPARASVADVVVGGSGATGEEALGSLPPGARVGTSSMRRRSLLAEARPDLEPVELRGNLDTRLRKVAEGRVDAAILAAAGIERLGLEAGAKQLDPDWWVPAPAQGALAVEAVAERPEIVELFGPLNDRDAWATVVLERAFSVRLEGGCSVPLGCLARVEGDRIMAMGYLGWPDGSQGLRDRISGGIKEAAALGGELADALLSCGGDEIIAEVKASQTPEVAEP